LRSRYATSLKKLENADIRPSPLAIGFSWSWNPTPKELTAELRFRLIRGVGPSTALSISSKVVIDQTASLAGTAASKP
jgi:hypothetical protein